MSTTQVEAHDLSHRWREVLDLAHAGAEIVITEGDIPKARLIGLTPSTGNRKPGLHLNALETSAGFDTPLPETFWTGAPS